LLPSSLLEFESLIIQSYSPGGANSTRTGQSRISSYASLVHSGKRKATVWCFIVAVILLFHVGVAGAWDRMISGVCDFVRLSMGVSL